MKKIFLGLIVFLVFLVLVNVLFLDWWIFNKKEEGVKSSEILSIPAISESLTASPSCQLACQDLIEEKIKMELSQLPSPAGQSSFSPAAVNKTTVAYIPLATDGSAKSNDWTEVIPSEFYFNLADYPGAKEVRFEAFLSSLNGVSFSKRKQN